MKAKNCAVFILCCTMHLCWTDAWAQTPVSVGDGYQLSVTPGGNLVVWPSANFSAPEIQRWMAESEAEVASRGGVTESARTRMKGMVRRGGGNGPDVTGWEIVIAQLTKATGGACDEAMKVCARQGGSCAEGSPNCLCSCAKILPPGAAAAQAFRSKGRSLMVFVLVPSSDQASRVLRAVQSSPALADFFLKV